MIAILIISTSYNPYSSRNNSNNDNNSTSRKHNRKTYMYVCIYICVCIHGKWSVKVRRTLVDFRQVILILFIHQGYGSGGMDPNRGGDPYPMDRGMHRMAYPGLIHTQHFDRELYVDVYTQKQGALVVAILGRLGNGLETDPKGLRADHLLITQPQQRCFGFPVFGRVLAGPQFFTSRAPPSPTRQAAPSRQPRYVRPTLRGCILRTPRTLK